MDNVQLAWYCGCYVGPSKWKFSGDWVKEPDECATEFETIGSKYDFDQGACVAQCPSCGAELNQMNDEPTIVEN